MTKIGKFNINKLSIKRAPDSPVYGITATGKIDECFYHPDNLEIKLNNTLVGITEYKDVTFISPGSTDEIKSKTVTDEYDVVINYVEDFIVDKENNFKLVFEGTRTNHVMTTTLIHPTVIDILRYDTALMLVISCDVSQFYDYSINAVKPKTPEARVYFSKMQRINHLGTIYNYVASSVVLAKSDIPSDPSTLVTLPTNLYMVYSSTEVPVEKDIEAVKHIYDTIHSN